MSDIKKLQEYVSGADIVLFAAELVGSQRKSKGLKFLLQTELEFSRSKDSDTTQTKDGPITTTSTHEMELSFTHLVSRGDPAVSMLENAYDHDSVIELWMVDKKDKGTETNAGKYSALYMQGVLTEYTMTYSAEDPAEGEGTFAINGTPVRGYVTLSEEQEALLSYDFRDITATENHSESL